MTDIWRERLRIEFCDVDPSGGITPFQVFDYFQKAAVRHAEDLDVGRRALVARGLVWILSRMSVSIERRLRLDEEAELRTWPRGVEKLFAVRDYDMIDAAGAPCVRGRSFWLLLDIEKRRPLPPSRWEITLPANAGLDALCVSANGLDEAAGLERSAQRAVCYSDIDFNGHVNNARYVQWIQDSLPEAVLRGAKTIRLDINYLSEVKAGEQIELWTAPLAPPLDGALSCAIEGRKDDAARAAAFRAELQLR
jgi:acyl-ACP thioesterase